LALKLPEGSVEKIQALNQINIESAAKDEEIEKLKFTF